jgi:2'-5' RNA ligase
VTIAAILLLDQASDQKIRTLWHMLRTSGLPGGPQGDDVPPHITLCISETGNVERWAQQVAPRLLNHPRQECAVSSVGVFPQVGLVFLGSVPTMRLREMQVEIYSTLLASAGRPDAHYRPDEWAPHITVAVGVPLSRLGDAVAMTGRCIPFRVTVGSLALGEVDESTGSFRETRHWNFA